MLLKLYNLLLFFFVGGCLILTILVATTVGWWVADTSPASIELIPIYPGATHVTYSKGASSGVSASKDAPFNCHSVSFTTPDAPAQVRGYYERELIYDKGYIRRGWVGDGSHGPFFRKARGGMQQLSLDAEDHGSNTLVRLSLCQLY